MPDVPTWCYSSSDVQAADDRFSGLRLVRVSRRRQGRSLLSLRASESGALGICAGAAKSRSGSRVRAAGHRHFDDRVRREPRDVGREHRVVGIQFLSPDRCALLNIGASGAAPVFALNRWWTVLSAAWLHGSLLHIVLNMYWVRQLGPAVAEFYGPGRMVIIYTAGAIVGFMASSAAGMFLWFMPPMLRGGSSRLALRRRFSACSARSSITDAAADRASSTPRR